MARKLEIILGSLAGIVLIWTICLIVKDHIRMREIAPEDFKQTLLDTNFNSLNEKGRQESLIYLTDQLNHLSLEGRRKVKGYNETKQWFGTLTNEERTFVVSETLPRELEQLRDKYKRLDPEERYYTMHNAMTRVKNLKPEDKKWVENLLSSPEGNTIVEKGIKSYYFSSSYPEKLEFSPLISAISDELEKICSK